jgi:hypothetical protein
VSCGVCTACETEILGECIHSPVETCFHCNPSRTRPACKPLSNYDKIEAYDRILDNLTHTQRRCTEIELRRRMTTARLGEMRSVLCNLGAHGIVIACPHCDGTAQRYDKVKRSSVACAECNGTGDHPALRELAHMLIETIDNGTGHAR